MNQAIQTRWLRTDAREWREILARVDHDFYHLPGYLQMSACEEQGEAFAFCAERGEDLFFLPLIVRDIRTPLGMQQSLKDVICPYGYAGPLVKTSGAESDFIGLALRHLICTLRTENIVSAFFRLNPVLPCPLEPLEREGYIDATGATVAIDLTLSPEEMWRQTRSGHRSDILRAKKNGYVVEMAPYNECLEEFREIYAQTMRRCGANDRYLFPREYFVELKAVLGDNLHLCVVRIDGKLAAGALFTEVSGIVQYHLSGVYDDFVSYHPTKALLDYVRSWARERGNRIFHLGGGLGGRKDSLFDFKAGFSQLHLPFVTWRMVVDPGAYAALTACWEQEAQTPADDLSGFFPAYRKMLPERSIDS